MPSERDRSNVIVPIRQLANEPENRHRTAKKSALSGIAAVAIAFGALSAVSALGALPTAAIGAAAALVALVVRRAVGSAARRES